MARTSSAVALAGRLTVFDPAASTRRDELQKLLAGDLTANNLLAWHHKTS